MVSSPDPQRDTKLARIAEIESNLKENEVLLHEDESDFNLFCYLRNMWQPKGKQLRIQTPRKNKKVYAFGVKEKATGKFYYRVFQRKRAVEFIIFLKHVFSVYKGKKIYMVLDNYVVHDCSKVRAFLEQNKDKIELLFLPTYSPDDNNVIEMVWGTVKEWINSNYMFADKRELTKYVHKGLRLYQLFKLKEKTS
jgi:putative transposase